jgi:hypothetical protein
VTINPLETTSGAPPAEAAELEVPFVVRGRWVTGRETRYESRDTGTIFWTPPLDLDALVTSRRDPVPAFDLSTAEVIDFLVATGRALNLEDNRYLADALDHMARVHPAGRRILSACYGSLARAFDRDSLEFQVQNELGGPDVLDRWRVVEHPAGSLTDPLASGRGRSAIRAMPPRLIHVMAGNGPQVAAMTIVRGALTKGVHVLKMASNDLFTATAILRTMADIEPDHPVVRSFSAVYWRGGDESVESALFRSQWFDKLVAWGGHSAMRSALRYLGPGFQLIAFDPKVSISLIGHEAFKSQAVLNEAVRLAAWDVTMLNQDGCACSRYQFIEASSTDIDRYCALLSAELAMDTPLAAGVAPPPSSEIRDHVDVLRYLEPEYRIWGSCDGRGLVIRSDKPVDFHPDGKTVNVIPVKSLSDAIQYVSSATQTVGVFPRERKTALRNGLASAGAQRVVTLGGAGGLALGLPQDAMYPLHRFVLWAVDEDVAETSSGGGL